MPSRSPDDLRPDAAIALREICRIYAGNAPPGAARQRPELLVVATYRSPQEQAAEYRRSRSSGEVSRTAERLRAQGGQGPLLADILLRSPEPMGTRLGRHTTQAAPGESWHQWGEAWDAVPWIGRRLAWELTENDPDYASAQEAWATYGAACAQVGVVWAGNWTSFKEFPHGQMRDGNPMTALPRDERESWAMLRGWRA